MQRIYVTLINKNITIDFLNTFALKINSNMEDIIRVTL